MKFQIIFFILAERILHVDELSKGKLTGILIFVRVLIFIVWLLQRRVLLKI